MSSIPESRIALTMQELLAAVGVCRTTVYAELAAGRLVGRKVGARLLFRVADINAWLAGLPLARAEEAPPPVTNRRKYGPALPAPVIATHRVGAEA